MNVSSTPDRVTDRRFAPTWATTDVSALGLTVLIRVARDSTARASAIVSPPKPARETVPTLGW